MLCNLCPRNCNINRDTASGYCRVSNKIKISRAALHFWEEPCISAENGSGTVFFSGCNMGCVYCQNQDISHGAFGKEITTERLAEIFLELQEKGAANINLVTPTHFVPQIISAVSDARIRGLKIPVVYNTSSYEKIDTLKRIDPYIDIYLPDMKFYSPSLSKRYLGKEDYFDIACEAVSFIANTKKTLLTEEGKMLSGCIVRHLVMPLCVNDSKAIIKWFAKELPSTTYLSLMSQYTPFGEIENFPELSRKVTAREYDSVVEEAFSQGLERVFAQERKSSKTDYIPSWDF
jgi:putative pyruvate formate lyase activating enzyme